MRIFQTSLYAATLLLPTIAEASEAVSERDAIVVTASRSEKPLSQVGQSITVITQKEIVTRQSVAVADLLRSVPGVTFTRNGGVGTTAFVYIRGGESDQTVALIDGVKINDPSSPGGGFNFGNLLTGSIARIEVLRGSQSVLWGSQAIGGVINIITREPGETVSVNARAEYGWRNTAQAVANISGKAGPVSASVGAGYVRSDGISAFDEALGGKERDGYSNYGANGKVNIALSDAISVDLRGWYSEGKTGIDGFAPPTFAFGDTREYARTREFVGYGGLNVALLGGRFRNRFGFAYTNTKRENFDPDGAPVQTFDGKGENERFEYQGIVDIADGWQATFGAETETSRYRVASFGGPASVARARLTSGYGQVSITPVTGFTATAGVRRDDHSTFGGNTSFAASAVYSPNDGKTTVRASYGEGFKAPTLFQLSSDYGNLRLRPETSASWDAGVTQTLVDGRIALGVTWFHRDTRNLIDFISCLAPLSGICTSRPDGTYDNVKQARAQGIEASLTLTPVEALTVQMNYGYLDATNTSVGALSGKKLARRPSQSINGALDYRWAFGLETGVTVTHVGKSFDDASNSRALQGYVLVDVRASIPVMRGVSVYARVENLFDEKYETISSYGTPGRAAYAGVRFNL